MDKASNHTSQISYNYRFPLARIASIVAAVVSVGVMLTASVSRAEDPMTSNPLRAISNKGIHKLFPFREYDEAFEANAKGMMTKAQYEAFLQGSSDDYYREMDYGITLPENQIELQKTLSPFFPGITADDAARRAARGRNNWIVWTGGNDRFWSYMTRATFGGFDLLKTISDYPTLASVRGNRWQNLGVVNEPCFTKANGPRADRWGLWLDNRSGDCAPDPYEDEVKYPGLKIGSRGKNLIFRGKQVKLEVGSYYGYATGIIGLRLFPNPDFDQKAASRWDPERYYKDANYYNNPNVVRPYRVGMACAFCHVGPNPSRPPEDFENPKWGNLNSNAGAQYFWVDRTFVWDWKRGKDNFFYQLLHTSRPGALDTSLVSSDQINNPRTMNAVYDLPSRVALAVKMNHVEQLAGNEMLNAQFSAENPSVVPLTSPMRKLSDEKAHTVISPRILKDGSDSVGALGALNRVYVNIGLFSENWIQNFIPLVGAFGNLGITPFRIDVAAKRSLFWQSTVNQTPDLALFFLAATRPDKLSEAPGGPSLLKNVNDPVVEKGKKLFAQNCAQCHSSKLPEKAYSFFNKGLSCTGANYMSCWNSYWDYANSKEFKDQMQTIVMQKDFLEHNFLSTEIRVPDNVVDSQLCSPIGTNAIKGDIWDNFSSKSYKELSPIGKFTAAMVNEDGTSTSPVEVNVPGGGRGYVRPASLISAWATAPFLQNNSLGKFDWRGSVDGRMQSFNDSINKLLDPELRGRDPQLGQRVVTYTTSFGDKLPGIMDVTSAPSYLKLPRGYIPNFAFNEIKALLDKYPKISKQMITNKYEFAMVGDEDANRSIASDSPTSDAAMPSDSDMGDFLSIGPIPAGIPINMISNLNLQENKLNVANALRVLVGTIIKIRVQKMGGDQATAFFMKEATGTLLKISKCNDFVVNRGHYFGTKYAPNRQTAGVMTAEDKVALIEFLKLM